MNVNMPDELEVYYTCPNCGEDITQTLPTVSYVSGAILVEVDECAECGCDLSGREDYTDFEGMSWNEDTQEWEDD